MGCGSSAKRRRPLTRKKIAIKGINLDETHLINTWSAGGKLGREEGDGEWTTITFDSKSCDGKIITCEEKGKDKVLQFEGSGTWTIEGNSVKINWQTAKIKATEGEMQ